ncbi:MAG: hypothetical protein E6H10_04850 [Bacteroidetes bacterium]|nr:MAG: hypothetical protein E6H10_04850 [Bacteroidota bacterium]
MKKKLVYVGLLIACVSFFSFKQICNDKDAVCVKQTLEKKMAPISPGEELNFLPLYNLLKI